MELNDIAYKFIVKEQYDKAYLLLKKSESIIELTNTKRSRRDKYFAYVTYHNQALCLWKLSILDHSVEYLQETINLIKEDGFFKDNSIA